MKNLLSVIFLSSLLGVPSVNDDLDPRIINSVSVDHCIYNTTINYVDNLWDADFLEDNSNSVYGGSSIFVINVQYDFNLRRSGSIPFSPNRDYIEINEIKFDFSSLCNFNNSVFYSEYSDRSYYLTFDSPVKIAFNYGNGYSGINSSVLLYPSVSITYERDDFEVFCHCSINDYNFNYTLRNSCGFEIYGAEHLHSFDDLSNIRSDFSDYLGNLMADLKAWGNYTLDYGIQVGLDNNDYNQGYEDGYTMGAYEGMTVGGGVADLFTLLEKIVNGCDAIFRMQVLPGISMGTVICIPLTAIIIVAIFKIVRG